MFNEKVGLVICSYDELYGFIVLVIEVVVYFVFFCDFGEVGRVVVIEVYGKCGFFDYLEVVSVGRIDC